MSSDHIPSEGTPEPSVETRLQELDDTFLELLRGQWSASAAFDNGFDNGFDNIAE